VERHRLQHRAASQYGHVIVADFNNDGKLDIVASQISG